MSELQLTRSREDRRLYEIAGVGSLRFAGLLSRRATAESSTGGGWTFGRRGIMQATMEACDAAGTVVGSFAPRTLRRGGTMRWGGRELDLQPASSWTERYALTDAGRELAVLDAQAWGKRPVRITLEDPALVDPGLLLFAAFAARQLADDASGTAGAAAAVTASG